MSYEPKEPTGDQCTKGERLPDLDGRPAFACWYPQMGGYVSKAVVVLEGNGGCFEAWVWHDGEFPFSDDGDYGTLRSPVRIHHCAAEQFIEFGQFVLDRQKEHEKG